MNITLYNDKIVIPYESNPTSVALLAGVNGLKYEAKKKRWSTPAINIESIAHLLNAAQFNASPDVHELYKQHVISKKRYARLKKCEFKQCEIDLMNALTLPMYSYQQGGAGFMTASTGSLLGDQPGLGKTIQAIASTRLLKASPILVFCPVVMKKTWQEEIEKWAPKMTSVIVSGTPAQRAKQWESDVDFYICNYHLLLRDIECMQKRSWKYIIADEATAIANPQAVTVKHIKKLSAERKIALTGTPLSNTVENIWSIMDWIRPGLLGEYREFIAEYCIKTDIRLKPVDPEVDDRPRIVSAITGYKNLTQLKELIEPYMLRRLKKDVLTELPPKSFENIYVEFSTEEAAMYEMIKSEVREELANAGMFDSANLSSALVKMVRLSQLADSCELINGCNISSKLDALKEIVSMLVANDEKVIIFTQFKEMALILMRELNAYYPLLIAGGMTNEERDGNRRLFNEDDMHSLLIMTSAGSMGLNLQRASAVVHYDIPWSISQTEQREDRAHRHGQKKNVTVYRMLVRNSIDEYKLKVLYKKQSTADKVLGDDDIDMVKKAGLTKNDLSHILQATTVTGIQT